MSPQDPQSQQSQQAAKIAALLNTATKAASAGPASPNASPSTLNARNNTRDELRDLCRTNLYFLCKAVIGFKDLSPTLHGRMCATASSSASRRQVRLYPRDHLKTSIFSIGKPLFEYINDQDVTILLAGSTSTNASRRLRRLQLIFEKNPLFRWLFPELIPRDFNKRWNETESLCPRREDRVEPTFDTIGVGGRVTGRHYMIKIIDDMVDETCLGSDGLPSKIMMDAALQWWEYSEYLLESEHTSQDIIVGTRWAREDPYEKIIKDPRYATERHAADGGCCEDHPSGTPIWPASCYRCGGTGPHLDANAKALPGHKIMGFTIDYLRVLQAKDPVKYALQMRNDPVDPGITEFKPSWEQEFKWVDDGHAIITDRRVHLGECNIYLLIDPAFTKKKKNDPTGYVVAAMTPAGQRLVLDAQEVRNDPITLIDSAYSRWRRWRPYEVIVEQVAGAKFIIPFLKERGDRDGFYIRCREVVPGGDKPKLARIRGLIGPFSRMEVWLAPGLLEFHNQLTAFPSSNDHLLDALAMMESEGRRPFSSEDEDEQQDEDRRTQSGMSSVTGY